MGSCSSDGESMSLCHLGDGSPQPAKLEARLFDRAADLGPDLDLRLHQFLSYLRTEDETSIFQHLLHIRG